MGSQRTTTIQVRSYLLQPGCCTDQKCVIGVDHSVIVYPESTDVVKIMKIATMFTIQITAYSGVTSLESHYRGVCIAFR